MPNTLRLPNRGYMRRLDVEHSLRRLYALQCIELIGMSNVGKSALLQLLADPDVWTQELGEAGREFFPVYVDCNRMLGLTEQGFCELVLRCLQESNAELAALPELTAAYNTVVAPGSDFQVPLSFSRGLTAALKQTNRKIVLLLDEFDDPYMNIDARVFLNLRAVQDRHSSQLLFVTATGRPLDVLQNPWIQWVVHLPRRIDRRLLLGQHHQPRRRRNHGIGIGTEISEREAGDGCGHTRIGIST